MINWKPGQLVRAEDLNVEWRDELNALNNPSELIVTRTEATNNRTRLVLISRKKTNAQPGDGGIVEFQAQTSTEEDVIAARWTWEWVGEHDVREARLRLWVYTDAPSTVIELRKEKIGFFGADPVPRPTVTGPRHTNTALNSLLNVLTDMRLITDETTS